MAKKYVEALVRGTAGVVIAAGMAHPTAAWAQSTANASAGSGASGSLDEIVVTANKHEEKLSRVGLTVTALSEAQLQQRNVGSLSDLSSQVPGLNFTQTDSATPVYTLRGIGFYDTTLSAYPAVSVYLDQAPLPFPVMTTNTLFDIERIEVLKGPQGTLFGNNATGGAINYIAAKPTSTFQNGVSFDYARFDTKTVNAFTSGPITDDLLARLAIKGVSGNDWQQSASRPGDTSGAPNTFAARFLLDWKPTSDLRIQTDINGWIDHSEPEQPQFLKYQPNFSLGPVDSKDFPNLKNPTYIQPPVNAVDDARVADWSPTFRPEEHNALVQAIIRADYNLTDDTILTSLTSYTDYKQRQVPGDDGTAVERQVVFKNNGDIRSVSQELRVADNADPVFRWTAGLNYSHDSASEDDATIFRDSTSAFTSQFFGFPFRENEWTNSQWVSNYAGFANGEYTISDFVLHAGLRYSVSDRSSTNCNMGDTFFGPQQNEILDFFNVLIGFFGGTPNPNAPCTVFTQNHLGLHTFNATKDQANTSWRIGADWKPTDQILVYTTLAKGYKSGSFPSLSGSANVAYTPVSQEGVLTAEAGVKATLLDRKLVVNFAAFNSDYDDKQVKSELNDPVFGGLNALVNVPKSQITGAETDLTAHPMTGLTLGAALTYLKARLTGDGPCRTSGGIQTGTLAQDAGCIISMGEVPGVVPDRHLVGNWFGNPIPYTSRWNAGASLNYTRPISDSLSGFFGAQVNYRSSTTSSLDNTPLFHMPGYYTLDLQAGLDINDGAYRVMAWGKNVTNSFYVTNVIQYTDGVERFAGLPVTFGLTVSAFF